MCNHAIQINSLLTKYCEANSQKQDYASDRRILESLQILGFSKIRSIVYLYSALSLQKIVFLGPFPRNCGSIAYKRWHRDAAYARVYSRVRGRSDEVKCERSLIERKRQTHRLVSSERRLSCAIAHVHLHYPWFFNITSIFPYFISFYSSFLILQTNKVENFTSIGCTSFVAIV